MLKKSLGPTAVLFLGLVTAVAAQDVAPNRSGFTMLLNLGVGFQHDAFFGQTETGVAGINLGLGGHVADKVAVMFRVSGTTVSYGSVSQTAGTVGATVQYWATDDFHLEIGGGIGLWAIEDTSEGGAGLIIGAGYSIWNNAGHNLYLGVEYAPAFTDPATIHNVGIVFGWQLL